MNESISLRPPRGKVFAPAAVACALSLGSAQLAQGGAAEPAGVPTLEQTRLVMGKWIETQQIIAKERDEWQQGKEVLAGRLELVKKEIGELEQSIVQAQATLAEADAKRAELLAQDAELQATGAQLSTAVAAMEDEVRRLFQSLPDPVQTKLQPLRQRIPDDPANTHASVAERFQNVLGILNELNKHNGEISVELEVRELANGQRSEVQALYLGLAQAWYVCANGEGGVGRPTSDGWKWEPSKAVAGDVLTALEILQGKHSPAFVPLPVKIQ